MKVLRPAHVWVEGIEIEPQLGPSIAAYLAEVQIERSRVLFRQGRLGEALAALNEISPPLGGLGLVLELARLYEANGKKSEAVGEYLRLLDLIPYHGEAISRIEGLGFSGVSTAARDRLLRRKEEISPQRMAEAVFGGRLQFLGWTVSPSSARPGEDVKVAYYWKCIEPLVRDADVFVHFESPGGGFQDDHRPRREDVGTGAWMKGEVVRYDRIVRIPPGAAMGRHAVYLGIWDPRGAVFGRRCLGPHFQSVIERSRSGFWRLSLRSHEDTDGSRQEIAVVAAIMLVAGIAFTYPWPDTSPPIFSTLITPSKGTSGFRWSREITCISSITCGFSRTAS